MKRIVHQISFKKIDSKVCWLKHLTYCDHTYILEQSVMQTVKVKYWCDYWGIQPPDQEIIGHVDYSRGPVSSDMFEDVSHPLSVCVFKSVLCQSISLHSLIVREEGLTYIWAQHGNNKAVMWPSSSHLNQNNPTGSSSVSRQRGLCERCAAAALTCPTGCRCCSAPLSLYMNSIYSVHFWVKNTQM